MPENKHMRGGVRDAGLEKELQVCQIVFCPPFSTEARAPLDSPPRPGNACITKDAGSHCPPMIAGVSPSSAPLSGLRSIWTLLPLSTCTPDGGCSGVAAPSL